MDFSTRSQFLRRGVVAAAAFALPNALAGCELGGADSREDPWATRPGELPPDGHPIVAGHVLPAGRGWRPGPPFDRWVPAKGRKPVFWCTNAGVDGAFDLARELAAGYSQTGLWPCLWLFPTDGPDGYCDRPARIAAIDAGKARGVLAEQWRRHPPERSWVAPLDPSFPGLAEPTGPPRPGFDPFGLLETRQQADASWDPTALRPQLMLVPCERPADAVAQIGLECGTTYAGVEDPAEVSSVLRSWEQRFHATLVGLGPGMVVLAVGAPPATFEHALDIAAEQRAFAPNEEAGASGSLARQARTLLTNNFYESTTSDVWRLGWND